MGTGIGQSLKRLATGCTVQGSNPSRRRDFPHPSEPALGSIQPPVQWVLVPFSGAKRPESGVDHPPPSSAEVKEK
jgi:hypothetical protein